MPNKFKHIRSGGQSGVDRAALDTARTFQMEICGWCPKGGWAEDYPDPPGILAKYPELRETLSEGTTQRTLWNMRDADAILTIIPEGSGESKGTQIGIEEGISLKKPILTVHGKDDIPEIIEWLNTLPDNLDLCIGGPRESECWNAYEVAKEILEGVFGKE